MGSKRENRTKKRNSLHKGKLEQGHLKRQLAEQHKFEEELHVPAEGWAFRGIDVKLPLPEEFRGLSQTAWEYAEFLWNVQEDPGIYWIEGTVTTSGARESVRIQFGENYTDEVAIAAEQELCLSHILKVEDDLSYCLHPGIEAYWKIVERIDAAYDNDDVENKKLIRELQEKGYVDVAAALQSDLFDA